MKRGITLMEVLIAMFVLLIGLLGVFSMLPVAKSYMADGVKYDAVSTMGHKAVHDLEVRQELMDPSSWFAPMAAGQFMEVCPNPGKGNTATTDAAYNYQWPTISAVATIPAAPFVLDPLACSYPDNLLANATGAPPAGSGGINTAGAFGPTFFPPSGFSLDSAGGLGTIGSPAITRVTVPRSGSVTTSGSGIRFCSPLPFGLASKIFQSSDDVLFNRPDDPIQRPFASLPTATTPTQFSTSQGDYSWFAVIDNMQRPWNPGPDGAWGNAGFDDNNDGIVDNASEAGWPLNASGSPTSDDIALWKTSGGELWHVSVVTVHKRNLQLAPTTATEVPPERMCYCDFLSAPLPVDLTTFQGKATVKNAGLGGNDVVLYVPNSLAPSPDWLNVKPNQWVMMSAWPNLNSPMAGGITNPVRSQLAIVQWFRISAVGEISQTSTGWQRPITLAGSDWNPYKFVDAIGAPGGNQSSYCTIVDGACGVFEAVIEQGE